MRQSSVENFVEEVEEVALVGAAEEDMEIVVVVDFRTVLRTEILLELKLLAFLMKLDVLSD